MDALTIAILVLCALVLAGIIGMSFYGAPGEVGSFADWQAQDVPSAPWGILGGGIFGRSTAPAYTGGIEGVDSGDSTTQQIKPLDNYLLTAWWSNPADKPPWATYTFGDVPDRIPALCSTTVRLCRDNGVSETCLFVGTGNEHYNMMLRTDAIPSAAPSAALVNFINWTGISAMPNPKACVYSCLAFDPLGTGIDDLVLGREDGLWYLRARRRGPLGFGSASRTTYEATWLCAAPPGSDPQAFPIAICVSRAIAANSSIPEGAKKITLGPSISRIWSSFFIAPGSLRIGAVGGHNFHVPTPAALSNRISVSSGGIDSSYYGIVGHFSAVEPARAELILPARYAAVNYALQPAHRGTASLRAVTIGKALEEARPAPSGRDQAALDALSSSVAMGDKAVPQRGADDTNGSHHIRSREGGVSDRTARPTEGYNHLESRKIMSGAYRQNDRDLRSSMGRRFQPCAVTMTGINPFDPSTLNEPNVRSALLGGNVAAPFFLRGFGRGTMNVIVGAKGGQPQLYNASDIAQIATGVTPTSLQFGAITVDIAGLGALFDSGTLTLLLG